jgi:hypothetical protein
MSWFGSFLSGGSRYWGSLFYLDPKILSIGVKDQADAVQAPDVPQAIAVILQELQHV